MQKRKFEDILDELKTIITSLESDNLELDDIVNQYEKGMALLDIANKKMENAQNRIEIISKREKGKIS